jgi:hypothetical protein
MTFLNWLMLLGLTGLAIPIVIHLLNRRKAQHVPWAAMRFLLEAMASQNRRILLEELVLLMLRCLLLALVVLAMARPFLPSRAWAPWALVLVTGLAAVALGAVTVGAWNYVRHRRWLLGAAVTLGLVAIGLVVLEQWLQLRRWAPRAGARDVVVVLDASGSMAAGDGTESNYTRARREANSVLQALHRPDAVGVVLGAARPKVLTEAPTGDHQRVRSVLEAYPHPLGGKMEIADTLWKAAEVLEAGQNPGKRIVVITDSQRDSWQIRRMQQWRILAGKLGALPGGCELVIRSLPVPESYNNLAIESVTVSREVVGTDRPVEIEVRVVNTGPAPMTAPEVELTVDDLEPLRLPLGEVLPGARRSVRFSHTFARAGRHILRSHVLVEDDLPSDDVEMSVLDVVEHLNVLVIDGAGLEEGAGENIAQALSPMAGQDIGQEEMLVGTEVVSAPDAGDLRDLRKYSVVVLVDVPRLPEELAAKLLEKVTRGGGLLVAPGPGALLGDSDPLRPDTFYNDWRDEAGRRVLPAKLAQWKTLEEEPVGADPQTFGPDALEKLRSAQSGVGDLLLHSYWKLEPDETDASVQVIGRLATGEPWMVQRRLGEGEIVLMATIAQQPETNLASLGCFPVMMHEAVYALADIEAQQGVLPPGARLVLDLTARRGARAAGLEGTYYKDQDFKQPVLTRIDPKLDFEWGPNAPASSVPADRFSVRWRGQLCPEVSGQYVLSLWADDNIRLWLDDRKLIDRWFYHHEPKQVQVQLEADRIYDLRVDFTESQGAAGIRLSWKPPGGSMEVIDSRFLFTEGRGGGVAGVLSAVMGMDVLEILTPSGHRVEGKLIRTQDYVRMVCSDTAEPGLYRILLPPGLEPYLPAMRSGGQGLAFSVATDASEGRLETSDAESLSELANVLGDEGVSWFFTRSNQEMVASISGHIPGQEVWLWLALSALGVLLAESALARWIAMKRRVSQARAIDLTAQSRTITDFKLAGDVGQPASGATRERKETVSV